MSSTKSSLPATPSPARSQHRWGDWRHLVLAALICTMVVLVVHAELWEQPLSSRPVGKFHDGHIWCLRQMARSMVGLEPVGLVTQDIGWPAGAQVRFIAWGAALVAAPFQWLGAVGAYNLSLLGGPVLSVLTFGLLFRRLGANTSVAAASALVAVVSPYLLSCMANGQIAKVHLWVFALWGLAALGYARGRRVGLWLLCCGLATALVGFTTPSQALFLPLVLVAILPELRRHPGGFSGALPRYLGLVLVTGVVLAACGAVYAFDGSGDVPEAFSAAGRGPNASMMAEELGALVVPFHIRRRVLGGAAGIPHLVSLPWAAIVGGALGVWARPRWLRGTLLMLVLSVLVVVGFWPSVSAGQAGGTPVTLWLMERGIPGLALYRAVFLVPVALAVLLAMGASRWRGGAVLAWFLALAVVGETLITHRWVWPLSAAPVPGYEILKGIADDPSSGAVLVLPLDSRDRAGQRAMLLAAVHGRATNGVPRRLDRKLPAHQRLRSLAVQLEATTAAELPRRLADEGVAWVLWHELPTEGQNRSPWFMRGPRPPALTEALGEPLGDAELRAWRVGEQPGGE